MNKILKSPYDLVAEALEVETNSITDESAMGKHHAWDSFNHLQVIVAIEKHYEISVPNEDFAKYDNMKAIIVLFEQLCDGKTIRKKGFLDGIKSFFSRKVGDK